MKNNKGETILGVFAIVLVLGLGALAAYDCDGTLVRGLFWFECVK